MTLVTDGAVSSAFGYDGLDRVTARNGTAFTYAGASTDPVSVGAESFTWAAGGLVTVTASGSLTFPLVDRHGDLIARFAADGTVAGSASFDPYGEPTGTTGTTTVLGYQSDYTDPTTGHVWMAARWYQPSSATFLSRDTYAGEVKTPFTLNRYTYGANNPIRYWDPTGRFNEFSPELYKGCVTSACRGLIDQQILTGKAPSAKDQAKHGKGSVENTYAAADAGSLMPPPASTPIVAPTSVLGPMSVNVNRTVTTAQPEVDPIQLYCWSEFWRHGGASVNFCIKTSQASDSAYGQAALGFSDATGASQLQAFHQDPAGATRAMAAGAVGCIFSPRDCFKANVASYEAACAQQSVSIAGGHLYDDKQMGRCLGMIGGTAFMATGAAATSASRTAINATRAPRPGAALDNNALIAALEGGELSAVDAALAGRRPLVSPTALDEFLVGGGSLDDARSFLSARGGAVTPDASPSSLALLQSRLDVYNANAAQPRVLHPNDACIVAAACEAGVPLLTRDSRLARTLEALGIPVEGF